MRGVMIRFRNDERGISSVVLAVVLIALIGAAMLTVDAGNLWTTRRAIITGTDAAALDAAQYFNVGGADPCTSAGQAADEAHATNVLTQNQSGALHNATDTPNGYQVTVADPSKCGTVSYMPGKVRFDARLTAQGFFSRAFGFGNTQPFSSSTAAWGYITALGDGLRPIAICDKTPQYQNWVDFFYGRINLQQYNNYFGLDENNADFSTIRFPATSDHFVNGKSNFNPNAPNGNGNGKGNGSGAYLAPDGTDGHRTIVRVTMPDPACGASPGNMVWVDFEDLSHGTSGASVLSSWLTNGYPGEVDLSPHDCNPENNIGPTEDCGAKPGTAASLEQALGQITCAAATAAPQCPYRFPILVVSQVTQAGGSNAGYVQSAFVFVVLRGFSQLKSNSNAQFDFEFVNLQTTGKVSGAIPVDSYHTYQTGTQLCAGDHDFSNHCPF